MSQESNLPDVAEKPDQDTKITPLKAKNSQAKSD